MLEGLNEVRWYKLRHAYGRATDVPRLLRAIASDDAHVRDSAWHSLYGNLFHQGTVYEATAHAVPFLIELAQAPQVRDRHNVLAYLGALTCYWDVHHELGILGGDRNKPNFKEKLEQELPSVRAAHEAVRIGAPSYAKLLADPSPLVRAGAAYLLGHFPQDAQRNIGWIRERIDAGEGDVGVRAASVLSIGLLATARTEATAWLEQVLAADEPDGVRVAAALGLAWSIRSAIPEVARALLIRAAAAPGAAKEVFAQFPWDEANVQAYSIDALAVIGGEPATSLPPLIKALDDVAPWWSLGVARAILHMVFAGEPKSATASVSDLSTDQRAALFAIAQSQKFWYFAVNAKHVLRSFGLPGEREGLVAFLDGNRRAE